jgi:hypothetical protein
MKELYIHIGMHKTATTFLQKRVFPNLGINYISQYEIMPFLVAVTQEDESIYDVEFQRNYMSSFFKNGKNIISAEGLSGNVLNRYRSRTAIIEKLKTTFPDAKIIIGIRNQKDMMKSLYKQYIQIGGSKKESELFDTKVTYKSAIFRHDYNCIDPKTLMYYNYLNRIVELFGQESVYIYLYEDLVYDDNLFISNICSFINAKVIKSLDKTPSNVSLPERIFGLYRVLNHLSRSYISEKGIIKSKYIRSFVGLLRFIPLRYKVKVSSVYDLYKENYKKDNNNLRKLGVDFSKPHISKKYYL